MSDQLKMSNLPSWLVTPSAISLPELASGVTPCDKPDGPTISRGCIIEPAHGAEGDAEIIVRGRVAGPKLDGLLQRRDSLLQPPLCSERHAELVVRFREIRPELDCLAARCDCVVQPARCREGPAEIRECGRRLRIDSHRTAKEHLRCFVPTSVERFGAEFAQRSGIGVPGIHRLAQQRLGFRPPPGDTVPERLVKCLLNGHVAGWPHHFRHISR